MSEFVESALRVDELPDTYEVETRQEAEPTCVAELGSVALCAACPLIRLFGDCPKAVREDFGKSEEANQINAPEEQIAEDLFFISKTEAHIRHEDSSEALAPKAVGEAISPIAPIESVTTHEPFRSEPVAKMRLDSSEEKIAVNDTRHDLEPLDAHAPSQRRLVIESELIQPLRTPSAESIAPEMPPTHNNHNAIVNIEEEREYTAEPALGEALAVIIDAGIDAQAEVEPVTFEEVVTSETETEKRPQPIEFFKVESPKATTPIAPIVPGAIVEKVSDINVDEADAIELEVPPVAAVAHSDVPELVTARRPIATPSITYASIESVGHEVLIEREPVEIATERLVRPILPTESYLDVLLDDSVTFVAAGMVAVEPIHELPVSYRPELVDELDDVDLPAYGIQPVSDVPMTYEEDAPTIAEAVLEAEYTPVMDEPVSLKHNNIDNIFATRLLGVMAMLACKVPRAA